MSNSIASDAQEIKFKQTNSNKELVSWIGTGVAAGVIGVSVSPTPARAATTEINSMVTSISTMVGTVTTVMVAAMTVRLAIKFVNRMTVKG